MDRLTHSTDQYKLINNWWWPVTERQSQPICHVCQIRKKCLFYILGHTSHENMESILEKLSRRTWNELGKSFSFMFFPRFLQSMFHVTSYFLPLLPIPAWFHPKYSQVLLPMSMQSVDIFCSTPLYSPLPCCCLCVTASSGWAKINEAFNRKRKLKIKIF